MARAFRIKQTERYNGPDFEEFCISVGDYLPASRDRTPCVTCPLSNMCQAGFEEQVRRVATGKDASLTSDYAFTEEELSPENVLHGLGQAEVKFLKAKVPSLERAALATAKPPKEERHG